MPFVSVCGQTVSMLEKPVGQDEFSSETLDRYFVNPPNEYRITQYQLTPDTLKKYPEYGIGSTMAFFYSVLYPECRTENYRLGENGPAVIGELVDAAQKIDYKVWLADDFGYPSGMAGGKVVQENPEYEVRGLFQLTIDGRGWKSKPIVLQVPNDAERLISAVIYPLKNGCPDLSQGQILPANKRSVSTKGLPHGSWRLCAFVLKTRDKDTQAQATMEQFGHTGQYPDLMNPLAVQSFIAFMHKPILAQIDDPAANVEGFYFNEPSLMQLHMSWDKSAPYAFLPWTSALPKKFQEMHGYDLMPIMNALYEGNDIHARRIRIHFYQTVAELLRNSFTGQIATWCAERGIAASGHFLMEEQLSMHVANFGDMMKVASELQVPALDIPMPNPDQMLAANYHVARLVSSIASWKNRDRVMCLLDPIIGGFGMSRLAPSEAVWHNSVNMGFRHGVNMFSAYIPLDGYSAAEYRTFNEYIGRIALLLRGAQIETSVALYYPIASFQSNFLPSPEHYMRVWDIYKVQQAAWDNLQMTLLGAGVDYNIVHPEALEQADSQNGILKIGTGSYRYLVMPQMEIIPLTIVNKIEQFEAGGGTVLWVDSVPQFGATAGEDSGVQQALQDAVVVAPEALAGEIDHPYDEAFDLNVESGTNLVDIARFRRQDQRIYYLVNRAAKKVPVSIGAIPPATVKVYDPSSGAITELVLPSDMEISGYRSLLIIE